jgi:hypothetical protein
MYNELEDKLELSEYKKLYAALKDTGLSAKVLNILWVNYSDEKYGKCQYVTENTVAEFRLWIKQGYLD